MMNDKIVLVTGASRGIGRAIARAAAGEGATVLINYNHSEAEAKGLAEELRSRGLRAETFRADVSSEAEVQALFKFMRERFGRLDVLVNNAGIVGNNLLLMTSTEELDRIMAVNCRGSFLCLRAAAKMMMKQRSGRIINLASIVGRRGNRGQAAYSASKAFVIGMTLSAAKELGESGICVNAIAPGFIDTDMTRGLKEEVRQKLISDTPLKRAGSAEDVAEMALFLMSDKASFINGQILGVDGGQVL
ncbi:MAG: 3-ketoacyl-(acyl-carrier-protein) reductase [Methanomassiliicoccales archaeon PtaU1.Bin030]|nr:MAG: 3-ketoacyl-(acyl-carrier-protein) reductase [Methanomassiliicoccales archaeon PtaU1.Bin030]